MTYQQFITECQRRQVAYCNEQLERMKAAAVLQQQYTVAMHKLGLHPLDRMEIVDRQRELEAMIVAAPETHGDGPAMRAAYDSHATEEFAQWA